ncbi:unnamed protein product [Mytilus coruscus]|uniref:Uncharacterized protein n=1 Tax=Mytilus coruscus TaxID=42192 RepID=A0A6J8EPE3_MYTCO|nr:unnamed protein product [Mytilus coruscus]
MQASHYPEIDTGWTHGKRNVYRDKLRQRRKLGSMRVSKLLSDKVRERYGHYSTLLKETTKDEKTVTIISEDTLKRVFGSEEPHLNQTEKLRTYTGEEIRVLGKTTVTVMCNNQSARSPITVVKGVGPNLMGRDWLEHLKPDLKFIFRVEEATTERIGN